MNDKKIEENRYNDRAKSSLKNNNFSSTNELSKSLRTPYIYYQNLIKKYTNSNSHILEIGAGQGENTEFLLATGASVCATDISQYSIEVIKKRFDNEKLTTKVADMESLPFDNNSFDIVVSAGSLSYGDNDLVFNEIYRVLNERGLFIAVDSLNHHPIYRLNRYIHYLKGNRSFSVLQRMPTIKLLEKYKEKFGKIEVKYFGSISYLMPLIIKIFGNKKAKKISDKVDELFLIKRSAFKFVLIAEKLKGL